MPLLKVNQIASYSGNTLTIGTTGDTVTLAAGSTSSGFGATYNSGLNWTSTLVTSALTVSSGTGYFVNTSTAAITVTLPASPTFGSIVGINDYSGYASTNKKRKQIGIALW
jgi:N6-adenosine-specific RNA methylase IME4